MALVMDLQHPELYPLRNLWTRKFSKRQGLYFHLQPHLLSGHPGLVHCNQWRVQTFGEKRAIKNTGIRVDREVCRRYCRPFQSAKPEEKHRQVKKRFKI